MKEFGNKKVAILYSGGRYFGGIEQYLVDLLDNTKGRDVKLEVMSLGKWDLTDRLVKAGHKVTFFDKKRISFRTVKQIGAYLKESDIELLVSQGTVANAYARLLSFIYKIPSLVTVHSAYGGDYSNLLVSKFYGLIDRLSRFTTRNYIAVSEYLKSEMLKSGISSSNIKVIYNGVNFHSLENKKHKTKVIGSVGRLHPVKGYDLLIQAFAKLDDKKVLLKIAGEGPELNKLINLAVEMGVADRVEFVGFKKDICEFLSDIDIYVQSSLSEGFGLSVVEAMGQGLPVVVTPVGNLKEIINDGETGVISTDLWPENIAAAIDKVLSDDSFAKRIGNSAKKYSVDNFSIKKWVDQTIDAYKAAMK